MVAIATWPRGAALTWAAACLARANDHVISLPEKTLECRDSHPLHSGVDSFRFSSGKRARERPKWAYFRESAAWEGSGASGEGKHVIYRLLGELQIGPDDGSAGLPSGPTLIILADLLMHANKRVSKIELIRAAWGKDDVD